MNGHKKRLSESLAKVQTWVEGQDYRGYEPFDGLSSPFRSLTFGNLLLERLLQQFVRQSPFNVRPLLGITKKDSTKGRGYMAWGYLLLHRATGERSYLEKAIQCLEWLDQHRCPRFQHHSWSNHFDFAGRGGMYTKDDPIIVWTSLIGHAFLEAHDVTGDARWLAVADSACGWIMALPRERTERGSCISYLAHVQSSIHNANMLGAGLLARTAKKTGNRDYLESARSAMEYSCSRQLSDGSWWYAEEPKYHWIDNFHTGYNLDSLRFYIEGSGDTTWEPQLRRGLVYYKKHFFEPDGCPKYYHNRKFPVDSQCAGQALDTLATFADTDPECLAIGLRVADWWIEHMQAADGHFYFRQYPLITSKTPMLHWSQAVTFKGLARLYLALVPAGKSA